MAQRRGARLLQVPACALKLNGAAWSGLSAGAALSLSAAARTSVAAGEALSLYRDDSEGLDGAVLTLGSRSAACAAATVDLGVNSKIQIRNIPWI